LLCAISGYYNQGGPKDTHVKIWGEAGWLELGFEPIANVGEDPSALVWEIYDGAGGGERHSYTPPADLEGGYTPFIQACVAAALSGGASAWPVTGDEAKAALQTVFAVYESQRTGQTVSLQ
jgi:predicted dehydrogenase